MHGRVLVVDDHVELVDELARQLEELGWEVARAATGCEALQRFDDVSPDVVLLDVVLPDVSGLDVLEQIKAASESVPVLMMSGGGTIDIAVRAMRAGAESFIQKPFEIEGLDALLEQAGRSAMLRRHVAALQRELAIANPVLPGSSEAIRRVNELVHKVARAPSPVLLEGESGTGKGMVARMLHEISPRRTAPRVELNCAGLSRELLESEIFGHERGAFTGAHVTKQGLFEIAAGGTVFLDEIGELEAGIQARLLKVIEEKTFRRVGGLRDIRVDVRLVAATNRSLEEEVREGRFRRDLLFRLNVIHIVLPPLRERREDVPLMIEFLLPQLTRDLGMKTVRLSDRALEKLASHSWPGNARELRNALERALLVSNGVEIRADDVLLGTLEGHDTDRGGSEPLTAGDVRPLDDVIGDYLQRAVDATGGNVRKAARLLGVSPSRIYARLGARGQH